MFKFIRFLEDYASHQISSNEQKKISKIPDSESLSSSKLRQGKNPLSMISFKLQFAFSYYSSLHTQQENEKKEFYGNYENNRRLTVNLKKKKEDMRDHLQETNLKAKQANPGEFGQNALKKEFSSDEYQEFLSAVHSNSDKMVSDLEHTAKQLYSAARSVGEKKQVAADYQSFIMKELTYISRLESSLLPESKDVGYLQSIALPYCEAKLRAAMREWGYYVVEKEQEISDFCAKAAKMIATSDVNNEGPPLLQGGNAVNFNEIGENFSECHVFSLKAYEDLIDALAAALCKNSPGKFSSIDDAKKKIVEKAGKLYNLKTGSSDPFLIQPRTRDSFWNLFSYVNPFSRSSHLRRLAHYVWHGKNYETVMLEKYLLLGQEDVAVINEGVEELGEDVGSDDPQSVSLGIPPEKSADFSDSPSGGKKDDKQLKGKERDPRYTNPGSQNTKAGFFPVSPGDTDTVHSGVRASVAPGAGSSCGSRVKRGMTMPP